MSDIGDTITSNVMGFGPVIKGRWAGANRTVPPTSIGRPSANLGLVIHSHLNKIDLASHILSSNPIPFSVVRTFQTNILAVQDHPAIPWPMIKNVRSTAMGYLDKLRGNNGSR